MDLPLKWENQNHSANENQELVIDDFILSCMFDSFPMIACNERFGQQGQRNLVITLKEDIGSFKTSE